MLRRIRLRWWFAVCGGALLAAALWDLLTRWSAVLHSAPSLLVTLGVAAGAGIALLVVPVTRTGTPRRGPWRTAGRVVAAVSAVAVAAALVWVRPFAATPVAVRAAHSDDVVAVAESTSTVTLRPRAGTPRTGLVFYPGARVEPRAYAHLLRQVAAGGYLVVIAKQTFNLAVLGRDDASAILRSHPGITRWVIGGHSLGGTMAAAYARAHPARVAGLLLWASYPAQSLAADRGVAVTSVYGSRDGLATPAKIDAHRPDLPPSTTYVEVAGAVHSYFGDYGPQGGDGTPTVSRSAAQQQIVAASLALLRRLDGAG